ELFFGYEDQFFKDKTIRIATKEKALFDFLYLKSFSSKEALKSYLLEEGRINWDILTEKDKNNFLKAVEISCSKKMQLIVSLLKKNNIL
ncbi:MAG: hypothetical protein ACD_12C00042G0003, partial [uncultured bacterium]